MQIPQPGNTPHTAEEKSRGLEKSAMGIVGLETAFPIVYTYLVKAGLISLVRMIELLCDNPRKLFRLGGRLAEGEDANLAVFDIRTPYKIESSKFFSMGRSTPFEGWEVLGRPLLTLYKGQAVWQDEQYK